MGLHIMDLGKGRVKDQAGLCRKVIISLGVINVLNMEVVKSDNGSVESTMEVLLVENNASATKRGDESG